MHSGQQLMVGMDVKIPPVMGAGSMKFDVEPDSLVIFRFYQLILKFSLFTIKIDVIYLFTKMTI